MGLLPRAMSGSMTLPQSGSVLKSMALVATRVHVTAVGALLPPGTMLESEDHAAAGSIAI